MKGDLECLLVCFSSSKGRRGMRVSQSQRQRKDPSIEIPDATRDSSSTLLLLLLQPLFLRHIYRLIT